jgi:hypothetical protein
VGKLIYSALTSLDLFVADETGNFDWAAPDDEIHTFLNDLERPIGTHLYGRRMYEVLVARESDDIVAGQPPFIADFAAIWRGADKIVYSRSLESGSSARTRIERDFDPDAIRAMKASADPRHQHRRAGSGGAGTPRRPGRRDPPLPESDHRRSWQSGLAGRRPGLAGAHGRAPVRKGGRLRPVPHDPLSWRSLDPSISTGSLLPALQGQLAPMNAVEIGDLRTAVHESMSFPRQRMPCRPGTATNSDGGHIVGEKRSAVPRDRLTLGR